MSSETEMELLIHKWFLLNVGGSLLLPSGWYGRPYDSLHALTGLYRRGSELTLTLDHALRLHFYGLSAVSVESGDLVFRGFSKLEFIVVESILTSGTHETFLTGEVRLGGSGVAAVIE